MKTKSPTLWMGIFLIVVSLLAVLIGFCRHFSIFAVASGNPGNNPNDFYLWSTNSAVVCSFRYDPREADLWQFRCAAKQQILALSMNQSVNEKTGLLSPALSSRGGEGFVVLPTYARAFN